MELVTNLNTNEKHYRLVSQIEASATSIAANIAEGKGRYHKKEFIQYLYIARGSLYETVTFLVIFHREKWIKDENFNKLKMQTIEIGKMISGLISSLKRII